MARKRVFISKPLGELDELTSSLTVDVELSAQSFLEFEAVEFEVTSSYDVIFFGSPRAFIFFKAGHDIPANAAIACAGAKTADLLNHMGNTVDFVVDKSGHVSTSSEEFAAWVGTRNVLFPTSNKSLKSYQQHIPENQTHSVVVYSTKINAHPVEESDVYVFTSPSNVEGFFKENSIPKEAMVIAWGESTSEALISRSVTIDHTLERSSMEELADYLNTHL